MGREEWRCGGAGWCGGVAVWRCGGALCCCSWCVKAACMQEVAMRVLTGVCVCVYRCVVVP